jgi:hypothetical protein
MAGTLHHQIQRNQRNTDGQVEEERSIGGACLPIVVRGSGKGQRKGAGELKNANDSDTREDCFILASIKVTGAFVDSSESNWLFCLLQARLLES